MITLENGLFQSLIVLEGLRANQKLRNYEITVGTFTNCREVGLTFVIMGYYDMKGEYHSVKNFTWCVYEHRNSDSIIINGKGGYVCSNGELPYGGDSKYSYLASFRYDQPYKCTNALADMIIEHVASNSKGDVIP